MKRTIFIAATGIVCLALITAAYAQQCTSVCSPSGIAGQQVCTTHCIPVQPGITHRYNGPTQTEQDYSTRAYEYELRRLEQENRR